MIVSTHEHVTPKTPRLRHPGSTNSRWLSRGDQLWERVIAPNRNVVLVLSGHFHGLGQIVTENAGGIEGHTVVELVADYQEFRTHAGDRGTGFQRLLQVDLGAGEVAVNTFSQRLGETASHAYDYVQFVPDDGIPSTPSNARPWQVLVEGLQQRYTAMDDEFVVQVEFQYARALTTTGLELRGNETISADRALSAAPRSPAPLSPENTREQGFSGSAEDCLQHRFAATEPQRLGWKLGDRGSPVLPGAQRALHPAILIRDHAVGDQRHLQQATGPGRRGALDVHGLLGGDAVDDRANGILASGDRDLVGRLLRDRDPLPVRAWCATSL